MGKVLLLCAVVVVALCAVCDANLVYVRGNIGKVASDPGKTARASFASGTALFDSYKWNPQMNNYIAETMANSTRLPMHMVKDPSTGADILITGFGRQLIHVAGDLNTVNILVICPNTIKNVMSSGGRIFVTGEWNKVGNVLNNGIFEYDFRTSPASFYPVQGTNDLATGAFIQALTISTGHDTIFYAGELSIKGVRASCASYNFPFNKWTIYATVDENDYPSSSSLTFLFPSTIVWAGRFSFVPFSLSEDKRIYNLAFINFADVSDSSITSVVLADDQGNTAPNVNITCRAVIRGLDDGEVIVAGGFSSINGLPANNIAKITGIWDGKANYKVIALGEGFDNEVASLFLNTYEDGTYQLYAGGKFQHSGNAVVNRIALFDGTGKWKALGAGFDDDYDSPIQKEVWAISATKDVLVKATSLPSTPTATPTKSSALSVFDQSKLRNLTLIVLFLLVAGLAL
mmetsp:Transcript_36249/g.58587  ORF Transcript_36249/g.58587 Transcript_36249/m.58587 type:complete len:460 (-) Transcript_36249:320-1699(-)